MFRMVEALEQAGHTCIIHLYDQWAGDLDHQAAEIRRGWPTVRAEVRRLDDGLGGLDACVATSWETAHLLARRSAATPCRRLYFVQDFEPFFYPRGSEYALAEDTYRFGFRTVSVGHMVADLLSASAGVDCAVAEFGCDTSVYRLTHHGPRNGIAFYARRDTPRRGFELASLALAEFKRRHPSHEVHVYGHGASPLTFPAVQHGTMSPAELSALYNRCVAGLAMSFTNISLTAAELLACGTIPVINDSDLARADLDNPHAMWARPTPMGLADALSATVEGPDPIARAAAAAASVAGPGNTDTSRWGAAQKTLVDSVEDEVYGPAE